MKIKQKIIIFILIITGVISLVIIGIIIPTIKEIKNISNAIYDERVDLEKKYQRGQLLRQTVDDFDRIKPLQSRLLDVFFETNQELFIVTTLENIATNNNLTQKIQVQPQPASKKDAAYSVLPLKITATGEFNAIMKYLSDIESLPYMVNSQSIIITKTTDDLVQVVLDAEVYMMTK